MRWGVVGAAMLAATSLLAACGGGGDSEVDSEDIIPMYEKSAVFILAEGFQGGAASGTGIVLDDDGHILTNNHVVEGAGSLEVRDPDSGRRLTAQIVGRSPCDDLAVIKVVDGADAFTPAELGTTDEIKQGSQVYAVGFPGTPSEDFEDTRLSITGGLVSKLDAQYEEYGLQNLIQMDVPLNHGNSGGPLVDDHGKVVGINTLGFSSEGLENVNYAISIDQARGIYEQLLDGKDLHWLGVNLVPNDPSYEDDYGIPYAPDTAVIIGVDEDSPLYEELWRDGDVIEFVEGKTTRHMGDVCSVLRSARPGDTLNIDGYGQFEDDFGDIYYDDYVSNIQLPE